MAVDNRIKLWELVTNTVKNLFMQDQSMIMFDHESDGNFGRVIGTPGTDPGGIGNGWATTYAIAEALGTVDSRPAGINPVFLLRAISGTWTATIGGSTLSGTGGAASTELFAGRNIIINGKVNKVQGTTGANTISLYKAADFAGAYTVYEVVTVAERLNGLFNSNSPNLTFSGSSLNYAGATSVRNLPVQIQSGSLTVSGAAGWRYVVCSNAGVVSVEVIPPAEITADTQQYTPAPIFSAAYQGYYSSVNPAKRIIGILYFDGTNIIENIPYGNGYNKNDDCWLSSGTGIIAATPGDRLQYTAAFQKTRGTEIVCTDNGAGNTDASGFRVTFNSAGKAVINISFDISLAVSTSYYVSVRKNGAYYKQGIAGLNIAGAGVTLVSRIEVTINDHVQVGDYFTFMIEFGNGNHVTILNPSVMFERF